MMMTQIDTSSGYINVYENYNHDHGPDQRYGLTIRNLSADDVPTCYLSAEQAGDLVAALFSLGAPFTEQAQRTLIRRYT